MDAPAFRSTFCIPYELRLGVDLQPLAAAAHRDAREDVAVCVVDRCAALEREGLTVVRQVDRAVDLLLS
jgi:hypothetical protein